MLFHNPPEDPFVREILALRRRSSAIARPKLFNKKLAPVSIETREPDLQVFSKIRDTNPMTLSVRVGDPTQFQIGDGVMLLQNRSHETLAANLTVLDIQGERLYLGGITTHQIALTQPGDLVVKAAETPSIVLSYVDSEIPQYGKEEIQEIREAYRDLPIEPPDPRFVRTPGRLPFGIHTRHFPLPDSPVPMGEIVLPIGPEQGATHLRPHQSGWMLGRILEEDLAFQRRWRHWADLQDCTDLPRGQDIPYCQFGEPDEGTLERMILCLNFINPGWRDAPLSAIALLFDWLLWSLGHPSVPEFPATLQRSRAHDLMMQVFSPGRLILYPADYFGALLAIAQYPEVLSTKAASRTMKSIFPGRRNDYRDLLLLDPQCSSGAMMLAASNYTYQYQAVTTDPLMAKATILNAYFYVPWCIFPFDWMPSPEPTTTLTTSLMVMRQRGIDPRYFDRVQLVPQYESYVPVALVELRRVNEIAEWLSQQPALPEKLEPYGLPDAQADPRSLPGDLLPGLSPSGPPQLPTSTPNLLPPAQNPSEP